MKTSDINYFIQVKVTNQKLIASDVTKFNAIANAPATRFTDIYGDSFISGFIEGGEFNALLSIKLSDSSNKSHIMAGLELNLEKGGVGVKAKAEGTIEKEDIAMKSTTSIEYVDVTATGCQPLMFVQGILVRRWGNSREERRRMDARKHETRRNWLRRQSS